MDVLEIMALFFMLIVDLVVFGFIVYHFYKYRFWFKAKRIRATLISYKRNWYSISYEYQIVNNGKLISVWTEECSDWNLIRRYFTKKFCGHDQNIRVNLDLTVVYNSPLCDSFSLFVLFVMAVFVTISILVCFIF